MVKRTSVEQILKWKERRGPSAYGDDILWRIDELARTWEQIGKESGLSDFIPIRLATFVEVFVRETVREIVDTSQVYLDRAEALLKEPSKVDFSAAKHLLGRTITMGDIAAHSISVNDIKQVISVYETLLPGYKDALSTVHELWIEDRERPHKRIIDDVKRVLAAVARVFEVRHIVTHEVPRDKPYIPEEVDGFLESSRAFISATDWYITGKLKGYVPRTQLEMNLAAGELLEQETAAMQQILSEIRKKGDAEAASLHASQDAWTQYADADANLRASLVAGGSMHSMIWATHKTELTRTRIKELRWWLEREEYDL